MKKLIILFSIFYFLFSSALVFAQISIPNPLQAEDIKGIIKTIINALYGVALAIIPIMIVIAAFMILTAAGEPKKIETAKKILLYTAIGVGVLASSWFIIQILENILGAKILTK